jgi:hypothetical protein
MVHCPLGPASLDLKDTQDLILRRIKGCDREILVGCLCRALQNGHDSSRCQSHICRLEKLLAAIDDGHRTGLDICTDEPLETLQFAKNMLVPARGAWEWPTHVVEQKPNPQCRPGEARVL